MPKNISWRKFAQKLRHLGYEGPYGGGRHLIMKKEDIRLVIPNPHRGDISKSLVAKILRDIGISREEWDEA